MHGDNINPVLVSGTDMTKDFAMMVYSKTGGSIISEFSTSVPGAASVIASAWGRLCMEGLVHTNCGPHPLPPTWNAVSTPSGNNHTGTYLNNYNQCVFLWYYTMHKKAGVFLMVVKAAVGPHNLGPGSHGNKESSKVKAQSDSDSGPDTTSSSYDKSGDHDMSSISKIGRAHV